MILLWTTLIQAAEWWGEGCGAGRVETWARTKIGTCLHRSTPTKVHVWSVVPLNYVFSIVYGV